MIYSIRVLFVILLAVFGAAFQNAGRVNSRSSLKMALKDYREELAKTAAAIAAPGELTSSNLFFSFYGARLHLHPPVH